MSFDKSHIVGYILAATGIAATGTVATIQYKQNERIAAQNNASSSTQSLPTISNMDPNQRRPIEPPPDNRRKQPKQSRLKNQGNETPAPAASPSSVSYPPAPTRPPAAPQPTKDSTAPLIRAGDPRQGRHPSGPAPAPVSSALTSGSDARVGTPSGHRGAPGTGRKTTKRATDPKIGESFLDMS